MLRLFSGILATIVPRKTRPAPRCTPEGAERAAEALHEMDQKNYVRRRPDGGWGMDEEGPRGRWHGPPEDGDTCPRCGSRDVKYEPGFAEAAWNKCGACGFESLYLW